MGRWTGGRMNSPAQRPNPRPFESLPVEGRCRASRGWCRGQGRGTGRPVGTAGPLTDALGPALGLRVAAVLHVLAVLVADLGLAGVTLQGGACKVGVGWSSEAAQPALPRCGGVGGTSFSHRSHSREHCLVHKSHKLGAPHREGTTPTPLLLRPCYNAHAPERDAHQAGEGRMDRTLHTPSQHSPPPNPEL